MNRVTAGAISGLAATAPMTLAMIAMHKRLPLLQQYPLPPRLITTRLSRKAGLLFHLSARERTALTLAAHFGYGATSGIAYALMNRRGSRYPVAKGIGFGIGLWAGSYLGWLPALGILPPATKTPAPRNALMIAAHVVWGGTCALLVHALTRQHESRSRPQRRRAR